MHKKIVQIGTVPPTIGGVSSHISNVNNRLATEGWEVFMIDVLSPKNTVTDNNELIVYTKSPLKLIFIFFKLIRKKYSLFHFHTSKKALPFIILIPFVKVFGKKAILSIHHGHFEQWLNESGLRKRLYLFILSLSDKVIFMNKKQAISFKEELGEEKVTSITPLIIADKTMFDKVYKKESANEYRVTTMGLWQKYYAYEDVVYVCDKISREYNINVNLDIVSGTIAKDEIYRKKFFDLIRDNKNSKFQISIQEDKSNILNYLKNRSVLVRASEIDSFGLCVAEALLVGTPSIATNVCSRPESTLLFEPHDKTMLEKHLLDVYNETKNITETRSLITTRDDSFLNMERLYMLNLKSSN